MAVADPDRYALYSTATAELFEEYGAKILARAGACHALEGADRPHNVAIKFRSMEKALKCYRSTECQAAGAHRYDASSASNICSLRK